ncbi:MAG: SO2930 family diheme c-type cytochrome [Cytophagales bacterium]|nr:SO2930 family diheme c-type cytochrome [Cytophagales bacterium]
MKYGILGWLIFVFACSPKEQAPKQIEVVTLGGDTEIQEKQRLSEWNLFVGELKTFTAAAGMLPYDLNTPLFSDYTFKARFVKLPEGKAANYHATEVMEFPESTILVKNFYYPVDFQKPEGDRRILETRLLINEGEEWKALTYVWNEEQTEAFLEIAGKSIPVSWTDGSGELQRINYSVPNQNQCKSCHEFNGKIVPIGPTARQLNHDFDYADGGHNQLKKWVELGLLENIDPPQQWPTLAKWDDPQTGTLDQRARAWLEINCAHCHRKEGPAKNTGLHLLASTSTDYEIGINKPPVAAGRGSAGLKFGIVPGKPENSILMHRIKSLDPGEMMPEVGRKLQHIEGIALVEEWIREMDN